MIIRFGIIGCHRKDIMNFLILLVKILVLSLKTHLELIIEKQKSIIYLNLKNESQKLVSDSTRNFYSLSWECQILVMSCRIKYCKELIKFNAFI